MTLEIISSEKVVFKGEAERVTLPGASGEFTVLDHHASLISTLTDGVVEYVSGGETHTVAVSGGFVDVDNNRVAVCIPG